MTNAKQEASVTGVVSVSQRIKGTAHSSVPVSGIISRGNSFKELRFKPLSEFPILGEADILYIDTTNGDIYYWNNYEYVKLCDSDVTQLINDLEISETTTWSSTKINAEFVKQSDIEELTKQIFSGTTAYWNEHRDVISKKDAVYVYTDWTTVDGKSVAGTKIGDGNSYVVDLPFTPTVNVTQEEKDYWNNKVAATLEADNLILYI